MIINIVEGDSRNSIESNQQIGYLEICGKDLKYDIIPGLDIVLDFSISESRDLRVAIEISAIGLNLEQTFTPNFKHVDMQEVSSQIKKYFDQISDEIRSRSGSILIQKLTDLQNKLYALYCQTLDFMDDVLTEKKYSIAEDFKNLVIVYDQLVLSQKLADTIEDYQKTKEYISLNIEELDHKQKQQFLEITKNESELLINGNTLLIQDKTSQLDELASQIQFNTMDYLSNIIYSMKYSSEIKSIVIDPNKHTLLIDKAETAIKNENKTEVKYCLVELFNNLKQNKNRDSLSLDFKKMGLR